TPEVQRMTEPVYERLKDIIPDVEWAVHAPYIAAINNLKAEMNAVLLVHNYQTPEIFHGVADFVGDSLALARKATEVDAEIIVQCGVHFMAETTKILNPEKTVLIPDLGAGCSLAASITAEDVRGMRERNPGIPVVSYVNTTAEVKAETDICCTSANAVEVVESLGTDKVIFTPDGYLAQYVAANTDVNLVYWEGACEVHERFTGAELREYRKNYPGIHIIAHPECPPDVLEEADFVGSTSGMIKHVGEVKPKQIVMITECSMSDNVAVEHPDVEFIRPCNLCPYMKKITLPKILDSLRNKQYRVEIDPEIAARARGSVERMLEIGR
ncbi:MAG: quinolinate synthase NadA, partial [Gammaproteobacteria bacterium]|nr:quinolinate synthase NadA [Gammaproteobacteria bacterium]